MMFYKALAVAVVAVAALCVFGLASPATANTKPTTVTTVRPVDRYLVLKPGWHVSDTFFGGSCSEGSDAGIPGADRCFVGNSVYDPCWPTVDRYNRYNGSYCPSAPWARKGILIRGHHHPYNYARGRSAWGIALQSGNRCAFAEGATDTYRGKRLNYVCQHGRVWLVGKPSKATRVWHILAIKYDMHGRVIAHWRAGIAHAWVAISPYGG